MSFEKSVERRRFTPFKDTTKKSKLYCRLCKKDNHNTENCTKIGCSYCGSYGLHPSSHCETKSDRKFTRCHTDPTCGCHTLLVDSKSSKESYDSFEFTDKCVIGPCTWLRCSECDETFQPQYKRPHICGCCQRCGESGHNFESCPMCRFCNKIGHLHCSYCHEHGHKKATCKKHKCQECGVFGHTRIGCPNKMEL